MTEQQIIDEILRYLHDDSYNYAVLIDGEWGSGKTYFVNNTLTKIIEKQESDLETSRKVQYISLYGCKAISDVQENIAWSFAEDARKVIKITSEQPVKKYPITFFFLQKKLEMLF